jgi:hypothetical protein
MATVEPGCARRLDEMAAEEMGNPEMRSAEAVLGVAARCVGDGGELGNGSTRGSGVTGRRPEWMKWAASSGLGFGGWSSGSGGAVGRKQNGSVEENKWRRR